MTHIHEHVSETLYDGESRILDVEVDINAETLHISSGNDGLKVTRRLRTAVQKEVQAMQDERDEEQHD